MTTNTANAAATASAKPEGVRTPWSEFWRKFRKQHVALLALGFVVLLLLVAIFAPWIVPFDPEDYFDYDRLNEGPSALHWLGVDPLGRDILSRILMGARISLATGLLSVALGGLIGTSLGLLAGYYEGWWDRIVMRISDVLFAFPGILLALGVVAILGSSMINVVVAVSVFSVPAFARLVRGNTLVLKQMTYVEAVRSIGANDWTIIVRHILPGTISSIVVYFTMRLGHLHHHGGQPVLPGHGGPAADAGVGRHAQRGARRYGQCAACGPVPQPGDLPHGAGFQSAGRWPARRTRSEDRPQVKHKP